ncbi:MAG: gamma-glutamylcyclotransferase family protein [Planctomycetota bacterium]
MPEEPTRLFVYGTLKRGGVRAYLLDGQQFLGAVHTPADYRLFNTGSYPALVEAAVLSLPGRSIRGELWEIDRDCLARLDEEEGVDEGLYERRGIALSNDFTAWAYLYLQPTDGLEDCGDCWPVQQSNA